MREIRSHTSLRGIAALLVVLYHHKSNLNFEQDLDALTGFFESADHFVDFFFLLSGFVIAHVYLRRTSTRGWGAAFYRSRLARIYPLHLVTFLFMFAIFLYRNGSVDEAIAWTAARNVTLIHAWGFQDQFFFNFPSWSISGEFAAYLSFPLIAAIVLRIRHSHILFACLALISLFVEQTYSRSISWERLGLLRAVPLFALGVALYPHRDKFLGSRGHSASIVQVVSAAGIVLAMHFALELIVLLPFFCLLIISTHSDRGLVCRLVDTPVLYGLGLISYTIYLMHIPIRTAAYYIWPKIETLFPSSIVDTAFVLMCLAATLGASILVYRFFEMPMRALLRSYPRNVQSPS